MLSSEQISAFLVVVEEGTFFQAAKRLHVTSSAISQRIKLLEDSVGQILLERTTPCTPTEAGIALLTYARQTAQLEQDALSKIQQGREVGLKNTRASIVVNAD